jgi:glycosyltransferase involved in cell wall biosynthesis
MHSPNVLKESKIFVRNDSAPLVSILIPVYNRRDLVLSAIDSCLKQSYENIEIIISDNCSTDGTLERIQTLYANHHNIALLSQESNLGPVANWYSCVEYSKGLYVKILFSDDIILPDCIKSMVCAMDESSALVYSACLIGPTVKDSVAKYLDSNTTTLIPHNYPRLRALIRYGLGCEMPVSPGSALFRRDLVLQSLHDSLTNPPCADALALGAGPDVKIFFDAIQSKPNYKHIPYPLVFFRAHSGSFTNGSNSIVRKSYSISMKLYYKNLPFYARLARCFEPFLRVLRKFAQLFA